MKYKFIGALAFVVAWIVGSYVSIDIIAAEGAWLMLSGFICGTISSIIGEFAEKLLRGDFKD